MARPRLPFRTDHPALMRRRAQVADQLYPGGIEHDQDVYVLRRRPSA